MIKNNFDEGFNLELVQTAFFDGVFRRGIYTANAKKGSPSFEKRRAWTKGNALA